MIAGPEGAQRHARYRFDLSTQDRVIAAFTYVAAKRGCDPVDLAIAGASLANTFSIDNLDDVLDALLVMSVQPKAQA